jgi:drug/metabolite transporter (DMT)-like permease
MLSVILAFSGAMIYGASDFLGGLGARRWSAVAVTFTSSLVGLLVLIVCSLVVPTSWTSGVYLWGILAGLAGTASLVLLYACLAIGPMSILAPIMGLISATLPVIVGFAAGEHLGAAGITGLILGLIAIVLICLVPDQRAVRASARGILLAIGSGACVGLYLVFIDLSPANSGPAPLTVVFAVSVVAAGGTVGVRAAVASLGRTRGGQSRASLPVVSEGASAAASTVSTSATAPTGTTAAQTRATDPGAGEHIGADPDPAPRFPPFLAAVLAGLTDAPATIMFLVALRLGDLAVVSVLSALAPAGTVVLAAILLRERIAFVQWLGLVAAVGAAALLSVP